MWYVSGKWVELVLHTAGGVVYLVATAVAGVAPSATHLLLFGVATATYYLSDVYSLSREQTPWHALLWVVAGNTGLYLLGAALFGFVPSAWVFGAMAGFQAASRAAIAAFVRQKGTVIIATDPGRSDVVAEAVARSGSVRDVVRVDSPAELVSAAPRGGATTVVVDLPRESKSEALAALVLLASRGVRVMGSSAYLELLEGRVPADGISERWFLEGSGFALLRSRWVRRLKRAIDVGLSGVALLVTAPVIGACALLTRLSSPGPAFFLQERVGKGGRSFLIYKLRTMVVHDPEEHSRYAEDLDPRVTPLGRFLRRTHLDELPQLYNIMRGDMSLIGPRAEWRVLADQYRAAVPYYDLRHAVRPGLTGWAQVCYHYGMSIDDAREKLRYDLYYVKHYSLFLDLIVAAKTLKSTLFPSRTADPARLS